MQMDPSSGHRSLAILAVLLVSLAACVGPTRTPSASRTPSSGEPSPVAGIHPPACIDARLLYAPLHEQLLLAGCVDQDVLAGVERVWAWDGLDWELLTDDGPPAAVVAGVTYDTHREVLVRYGGLTLGDDDCLPETWEWASDDGWRLLDAETPPACDHLRLVYDPDRRVTILTGGGDDDGQLIPGTWAWDGAAWTGITDEGPLPRAHFGFVFDETHGQALLYGGYDGQAVFEDLWSWDGAAWTELGISGPGPRSHAGMAADPDGLLLFGGATTTLTFGSLTGETWYLTDGSWRELEGAGPSPRGLPAVGYDPGRDVMVLYGGFGPDGAALADLWEWDGAWTCVAGCS
jgi:hypothetical protein